MIRASLALLCLSVTLSLCASTRSDFNGDGWDDLVWVGDPVGGYSTVALWLMQSEHPIAVVDLPGIPSGFYLGGVGDFNADGKPDLLWRRGEANAVWLMNGTSFESIVDLPGLEAGIPPYPYWTIKGVGDFDGDGDADILWHDDQNPRFSSKRTALWLMNGVTVARIVDLPLVGGGVLAHVSNFVATGDIDGDGTDDTVQQSNYQTNAQDVWLMKNGAIDSTRSTYSLGGAIFGYTAFIDLDKDGDDDLIATYSGGPRPPEYEIRRTDSLMGTIEQGLPEVTFTNPHLAGPH
jgi:hypothetical protein